MGVKDKFETRIKAHRKSCENRINTIVMLG